MDQSSAAYSFGAFRLDATRRILEHAGKPVSLSARGFDILHQLITARDRVVSREELVAVVWPGVTVDASNLTVQMSALRRALNDTAEGQPTIIATVPGRGYQFVGLAPDNSNTAPKEATSEPPQDIRSQSGGEDARSTSKRILITLALSSLLVVLAEAYRHIGVPPAEPHPGRLSIAIIPFRNLSDDSRKGYIAEAVSDDLTTALAQLPGSQVTARESADAFKAGPGDARQARRTLNVSYLLEGSVRAEGDAIRLNVKLINTESELTVWAEHYDTTITGLWDNQANVVNRIGSILNVVLVDNVVTRLASERPEDNDALDDFFRARSILNHRHTLDGLTDAQHLLEAATKLQPHFTDALCTLGWTLLRKVRNFEDPTYERDRDEAAEVIQLAFTLSPRNPDVLSARGRLLQSLDDCPGAASAYHAALGVDPSNVAALSGLAMCAWQSGSLNDETAALESLMRIDPEAASVSARYQMLGLATLFSGHVHDAVGFLSRSAALEEGQERAPDQYTPREATQVYLAAATLLDGHRPEAQERMSSFTSFWPHRSVWRMMALLYPAELKLPQTRRIAEALVQAGLPKFIDETEDFGMAEVSKPLSGGQFSPTPTKIHGAETINTATLKAMLQSADPPVVVDVGQAAILVPGAIALSDSQAASSHEKLDQLTGITPGKDEQNKRFVIMGTGTTGVQSVNTVLHFLAVGIKKVYWYRGGEEAWFRNGLPIGGGLFRSYDAIAPDMPTDGCCVAAPRVPL